MSLEKLGKLVESFATTTAKKAGEQVQIAKLGIDKSGLERQVEGVYAAIGRYCYSRAKAGEDIPSEIRDYCRDIDLLCRQIRALDAEIEKHKAERNAAVYTTAEEPMATATFTEERGRRAAPSAARRRPAEPKMPSVQPVAEVSAKEDAPWAGPLYFEPEHEAEVERMAEIEIEGEIEGDLSEAAFDPAKEAETLSASLDEALEEMIAARKK